MGRHPGRRMVGGGAGGVARAVAPGRWGGDSRFASATATLPGGGSELVVVPGAVGVGRLPRGRHGPGQNAANAGLAAKAKDGSGGGPGGGQTPPARTPPRPSL